MQDYPDRWRHDLVAAILLLAAIILAILVYRPGLPGPLLLDDRPQLDPLIEQSGEPPAFLLQNFVTSTSGPLGRPVSMVSFVLDAVAHGPDLWWWKFDSLMLHLVCGLLLAWLIAELVRAAGPDVRADAWIIAALVAGAWLLHPLNLSTVLYTVQRMTILSTLFVYAGLICYVKGRLLQVRRPGAGWLLILAALAVCMPLAVFSKESGALFPVYCTLLEFIVLRFRGSQHVRQPLRILHGILLAGYAAGVVILLVNWTWVTDAYAARHFTLIERVLTEFRVLVAYLWQIVLPLPGRLGFFHDDFPLSRSLIDPITTLPSMVCVIAMISGAWIVRKRFPLVAFGLMFFFASHALESTVFGLELMFEHRNYTGSPGILLALIIGLAEFARRDWVVPGTAAACIVLLALLTWQRASSWSSPLTMYQHMYAVHPESPRLNMIFSDVFARAGEFDNARQMLNKIEPGAGRTLRALYLDCLEQQSVRDYALSQLASDGAGILDEQVTSFADLLVDASIARRCEVSQPVLVEALDRLLSLQARSYREPQSILVTKARLQGAMDQTDAAMETFIVAQSLSDVHALPLYRAADMLAQHGRAEDARLMLKRASDLERSSRIVRKDLAERIYAGIGEWYVAAEKPMDAIQTYDEALDVIPENLEFQVTRAELQLALGQLEEASHSLAEIAAQHVTGQTEYERRLARIKASLEKQWAEAPTKP